MPPSVFVRCAGMTLLLVVTVRPAVADPVRATELLRITAGSFVTNPANDDRDGFFTASGANFTIALSTFNGPAGATLEGPLTLDPSVSFSTGQVFGTVRVGTGLFEINPMTGNPANLSLSFSSPPQLVIPPPPDSEGFSIAHPFTLAGALSGRSVSGQEFMFNFTGQGQGSTGFALNSDGSFFLTAISFGFDAAPIPEPGTLLLFAVSGVAGAASRMWRRAAGRKPSVGDSSCSRPALSAPPAS